MTFHTRSARRLTFEPSTTRYGSGHRAAASAGAVALPRTVLREHQVVAARTGVGTQLPAHGHSDRRTSAQCLRAPRPSRLRWGIASCSQRGHELGPTFTVTVLNFRSIRFSARGRSRCGCRSISVRRILITKSFDEDFSEVALLSNFRCGAARDVLALCRYRAHFWFNRICGLEEAEGLQLSSTLDRSVRDVSPAL